jgi:hypothetical protein
VVAPSVARELRSRSLVSVLGKCMPPKPNVMVTSPWLGLLEVGSGISSTTDTSFASSVVSLSHYQTQYLRLHDSAFRNQVAVYPLDQWSSTWGKRRHLTSMKTKHRNRLNFGPDLILALTKIRFSTLTINNCQNYYMHLEVWCLTSGESTALCEPNRKSI